MQKLTGVQVVELLRLYKDIPEHIQNLQNALGNDDATEYIYTMSVAQTVSDLPRASGTSDKTARVAAEYAARSDMDANRVKTIICAFQNVQAQIEVALKKLPEDERREIVLRHVEQHTWRDVCRLCEESFGENNYRCEKTRKERVKRNVERIRQFLYISESDFKLVMQND